MHSTDSIDVDGQRVTFRPTCDDDDAFLESVYASTRADELAAVPWSPDDKQRFIAHQFRAQDDSYRRNYPGADFLVLTVDGADAGRLYLHRRPLEIRIMDIALLPAFRRHGIGTAVLRRVLDEGARDDQRVTIHVETFNPALRLYERLGFRRAADPTASPVYVLLEWRAAFRDNPDQAQLKSSPPK